MNEFDITRTYTKGDSVIFDGNEYVFDPKVWHGEFSTGFWPGSFGHGVNGWETTLLPCSWIDFDPSIPGDDVTLFYTDSEPNELTVLDCKDKMINEI